MRNIVSSEDHFLGFFSVIPARKGVSLYFPCKKVATLPRSHRKSRPEKILRSLRLFAPAPSSSWAWEVGQGDQPWDPRLSLVWAASEVAASYRSGGRGRCHLQGSCPGRGWGRGTCSVWVWSSGENWHWTPPGNINRHPTINISLFSRLVGEQTKQTLHLLVFLLRHQKRV